MLGALRSVAHGAVVAIVGIGLQKLLLFATTLLLTNGLGVGVYGVYAFANRLVTSLGSFALLGAEVALLRYIPEADGDPARRDRVFGLAVGTVVLAGLGVAVVLYVLAPWLGRRTIDHPLFVPVFRTLVLALPLLGLVRLTGDLLRSLELIVDQTVVVRVALPGLQLCAVALALVVGFDVVGLAGALVGAAALTLVVAVALAARHTTVRPAGGQSVDEVARFANYAGPVTLGKVGGILRNRVDVLLVGALLSATAAGIYNVALFLTGFVSLSLLAFNQLFPPVAAKLYATDRREELDALYSVATRWIFTGGVAVAVVEFVFRSELLALFGTAYTDGRVVLSVFVVGQVVNCSVGSAGWLLQMTDHQYLNAANNWLLAVLNVGVSYLLVLEVGLVGAAVGTAGSLALVNLLRVAELWYLEGLQPYTRRFVFPLAAGGGYGRRDGGAEVGGCRTPASRRGGPGRPPYVRGRAVGARYRGPRPAAVRGTRHTVPTGRDRRRVTARRRGRCRP
nr:oligosaccharide flippase family protein [Halomarina oriensis]